MNDLEQTQGWPLISGHPALDFVNTVGGNDSTAHLDAIADYDLLVAWSLRVSTLEPSQADALLRRARRRRAEANATMRRARSLRGSLDAVFGALLVGDALHPGWARARPVLPDAVARAELVRDGDRAVWSWARVAELDAPLLPVAYAAAALVTDPQTAWLRRCDRCRWLFLDTSRNHARRWCDMRTCGVAQKVERQAMRRRER